MSFKIKDRKDFPVKNIVLSTKNPRKHFRSAGMEELKNPSSYPGNKITGLKQITERFLDLTVSKYYKKIQQEKLSVKFVINTVRANLFQGGRDVKRNQNITMVKRGGDGARKAISPSRTDEPPRLLIVKNKGRKVRPKSKPKKKITKVKTFKFYKEDAELRGSCAYCGDYIKIRYTSNFIHVNIDQNPAHHYFCSKECKINWISALLEKKKIAGGIEHHGA